MMTLKIVGSLQLRVLPVLGMRVLDLFSDQQFLEYMDYVDAVVLKTEAELSVVQESNPSSCMHKIYRHHD